MTPDPQTSAGSIYQVTIKELYSGCDTKASIPLTLKLLMHILLGKIDNIS